MFLQASFWVFCKSTRESCAFVKDLARWCTWRFDRALFSGMKAKLAFQCMSARLITSWFGHVAMWIRCLGSWWNPEARMLARNLRRLSPHRRYGLAFLLYFFINIESMMLPSFSFTQAGLTTWQWKLHARVCNRALSLGCLSATWDTSIYAVGADLFFFSDSLVALSQQHCQV